MPDSAGVRPPKRRFAVGKPSVRPSCLPVHDVAADRVRPAEQALRRGEIAGRAAPRGCAWRTRARRRAGPVRSRRRRSRAPGPSHAARRCRRRAPCRSGIPDRPRLRARTGAAAAPCARIPRRCRLHRRLSKRSRPSWSTPIAQALELSSRAASMRRGGGSDGAKNSRGRARSSAPRTARPSARARDERVAHQRLVAEVQAVECADADHTAVRAPGPAFDVSEQPAHRSEV